ncbi:MAG: CHAT domain-containing protein [Nostoc sp.]|uniref:WD40 domain-containing protein n=1 Tax=Nostoc sp. TaxID=1180 RepID=UPI002FEF97DD
MVSQISGTLTITVKKQAENYTIEASGTKGIRVDPQYDTKLKTLLSDPQITDTIKKLSSPTASETTDGIQKLGKALYNSLFTNQDILLAFGKVQGSASADNGVRLRLQIEPTELAALPWETLHNGKDWLSAQSTTPLVRKLNFPENRKPLQKLQIRGALRILFVGASPEGLDDLKVEKTADELERLLDQPIKRKQIIFDKLLNATLEDLQKGLLKDYHILYFAGHGSPEGIFLDDGEGDVIEKEGKVIGRERGDKTLVSAETLAQALKGKQTRLVFLAACETSKASEGSRLLRGFAQELAERSNLPAIVAMQYFISDMQANPLTTQFFAALAAGRPVDVAMAEARAVLMKKGQVSRDVFSPVLYLQAEDGALFPKAKNWPAISLGVALLIAATTVGAFARSAEINQIRDWISSSQSKLKGDDDLGAEIDILRAGKNLQQSFWQAILPDFQLRMLVLGQLQQTENNGHERNRMEGHQGIVNHVVFSPNGKQLATSGNDSTARLWDMSGKQLAVLKGHQRRVRVMFSPDGKQLATSGNDSTARLWDISGKQLAVLGTPVKESTQDSVYGVVFSPDGQLLVTGGEYGARLWDRSGKQLAVLKGQDSVQIMEFSPDGQLLATGGDHVSVHLWDRSGKQLAVLKDQDNVQSMAFSPDGQLLAIAIPDGITRLWDTSGKQLAVLKGNQSIVYSIAFSPDGKQLATSGDAGSVHLWDTSGKELADLGAEDGTGGVYSVVFSPNGKQLATCGEDGIIRLWDTSAKRLVALFKGHQGSVSNVVFSRDGKQLVSSGGDGTIRVWNISGKQLAVLEGHQGGVRGHRKGVSNVVFSPDGKKLATSGNDGTTRLWDKSGKQLAVLEGLGVSNIVFSPDGKELATSGNDGTTHLWDTSGKQLAVLEGLGVSNVVFSPDGKELATSDNKGTARLWDTSGKQLAVLGELGVHSVVFSPDGKELATSGNDGTARLWDTSGKQLAVLVGLGVHSVVFSPDGKELAVSGYNSNVYLWDKSGKQLVVLEGHQGIEYKVVFSPDGKELVTSGYDNNTALWDKSGKQLAVLEEHQGNVSVVFSPDGKQLATSGNNDIIHLWDTSGKQLAVIEDDQGTVNSVMFSPDGKELATSDDKGTTRLWDTSGKQLAVIEENQGTVNRVVFSPNGKELATSGYGDSVYLWQVGGIDELLSKNCDWVRDYLENSPNITESDRHLCDGIGRRK